MQPTYYKSSKYPALSFDAFFSHLPVLIIISYLMWSRAWYFINQLVIFPTSFEQLLLYLTPTWRNFSLLWIVLWATIWIWLFLKKYNQTIRTQWIDVFFESLSLWLIPLWIFLVLWDSFIWLPTQSIIWVSAIRADSQLALYNSVLPLWFGVTLLWVLTYAWCSIFRTKRNPWYGYLWLAWILVAVSVLTIYQNYARRLIVSIGDIRLDIKQYAFFLLAGVLVGVRLRIRKKYS